MKHLAVLLLALFLAVGCAPLRTVAGNTLISHSPPLRVKAGPGLKYLGQTTQNQARWTDDQIAQFWVHHDAYFFISSSQNYGPFRELLMVGISTFSDSRVEAYGMADLRKISSIRRGTEQLGAHPYQYVTFLNKMDPESDIGVFLKKNGYEVPDIALVKFYTCRADTRSYFNIWYLENLSTLGSGADVLLNSAKNSEEARRVVDEFEERVRQNLAILEK